MVNHGGLALGALISVASLPRVDSVCVCLFVCVSA